MKQVSDEKKRLGALVLGCTVLFCALCAGAFFGYRAMLTREFSRLTSDNLSAYTASQHREVQQYLTALQNTMEDSAELLSTARDEPESAWARTYMARVSANHERYHMSYVSLDALENMPGAEEQELLRRLRMGQSVMSNVQKSDAQRGCYFAIADPVTRGGVVVGAVRGMIPAEQLMQTSQTGYLRGSIQGRIVTDSGDVVPLTYEQEGGVNLFERNLAEHGSVESDKILRQSLAEGGCKTVSYLDASGKRVFVSSAALGYHGWNLVNVAGADDVIGYSAKILQYSTMICVGLVLCIALLMLAIFMALGHQRRRLRLSEMRYDLLSRFSDTTLFAYEYKTDTMDWSENARQLLAMSQTHLPHYLRDARASVYTHPNDLELVRKVHQNRLPEGQEGCAEARMLGADGSYHWCSCRYQTLYDNGVAALLVGKLTDISTHKEREHRLQKQVAADSLTGLLNALALREQVQACAEQAECGYFFLTDVDNFKQINDTYGHAVGDAALRALAAVLRKTFREGDLIGRIGGDEFAVLLRGVRDRETAKAKARALLRAVQEIRLQEEPALRLSASIGITGMRDGLPDVRSLYAVADHAMYTAKREGRNGFHVADAADE